MIKLKFFTFLVTLFIFSQSIAAEVCNTSVTLDDVSSKAYFSALSSMSPIMSDIAYDVSQSYAIKKGTPINSCVLHQILTTDTHVRQAYDLALLSINKKGCQVFNRKCLGNNLNEYELAIKSVVL